MSKTTTIAALILGCTLLSPGRSHADQIDDALNKYGLYAEGIAALGQNKNEVAALTLRDIDIEALSKPAKIRVLTRIAEAEVRGGNHAAALALFDEPGLATDPQAKYWRAIALVESDRRSEAQVILEQISKNESHPHWPEASLTLSSILLYLGAPDKAIAILQPLVGSKQTPIASRARLRAAEIHLSRKQWPKADAVLDEFTETDQALAYNIEYLRALSSIGKEDWPSALARLQPLSEPDTRAKLPPQMRDGVVVGLVNALRNSGDREGATALLHSFIGTNPESPNLTIAFESLGALGVYEAENLDENLVNWANSPTRNLAATATYFKAIAQTAAVSKDAAVETLETIRSDFNDHPIAEKALLRLSEIYVADANKPEALEVLKELQEISTNPAVLSRIEFIEARASFAARDFKQAADKFADAAKAEEGAAATATYNSAIASLKSDDIAAFNRRTQILAKEPESQSAESLELERALYAARLGEPGAADELEKFLTSHPEHPRRAEANLALAYLQLNQDFAKIVSARKLLKAARTAPLAPQLSEEADYIAFWIEIAANETPAAVAAGEQFVKNHPGSTRSPELLFKMGAIHFRDGLFPAAQTNFERLAIDYPTSPRAEIALFTAGRSAMRTGTPTSRENAIKIFSRVAELGGEFATSARLQQARIRRNQLEEDMAISILDSILQEKPTGELLFSTLITKGESLFVLGDKNIASLAAAVAVFNSIAKHPEASNYWYNQSLTRKGKTLERLGKVDEALVAYEAVISKVGEDEPDEYDWFYKAGFAAIRIYEERKNWKAAIATADILASKNGPGAQAARERSKKIETKNFIWRD